MDGHTEGRTNGRTDGQTERERHNQNVQIPKVELTGKSTEKGLPELHDGPSDQSRDLQTDGRTKLMT